MTEVSQLTIKDAVECLAAFFARQGRKADWESLVQEVIHRYWASRRRHELASRESKLAFLITIAKNLHVDLLRRHERRGPELELNDELNSDSDRRLFGNRISAPVRGAMVREFADSLRICRRRIAARAKGLSPRYRKVFFRRFCSQEPWESIATRADIHPDRARSFYRRFIRELDSMIATHTRSRTVEDLRAAERRCQAVRRLPRTLKD